MQYDEVDYSRYYMKNKHTYNEVTPIGHEVEYTGRGVENKQKVERGKRNKRHKKSHRRLHIFVVLTLIVIAGVMLIADAVHGGYIIESMETLFAGKSGVISTYYGVEVGTFDDMDSARLRANEMRKRQGAGYVLFDEGYRVFVEMYGDIADAENIAKRLRLSGENASVYAFEVTRIDYSLFPDSTRNIVKSSIAFNDRIYRRLYAIGVELAEGKIDSNSAKMRIKGLRDETHNVIAEYTANVDNAIGNVNVLKVKAELVSIESMLDNLATDVVKRPSLMSDIRYTSCLIVNSYRELARELS